MKAPVSKGWKKLDAGERNLRWVAVDGGARMRGGLASLRDAGVIRVDTGGVVALLLNHRLMSGNPPGSGRGVPGTPDGVQDISPGLSVSDTPG